MKYKKICKEDVYDVLIGITVDIMSFEKIINIINIANFLKTSKYQVKKYIDELKKDELIELKCVYFYDEEDIFPPYWGYKLTEKGRNTEHFKIAKKKEDKIIKECFCK